MAKEAQTENKHIRMMKGGGSSGAIYGLGFIGALIYYIQHAANFWEGVLGILKAILWPAFLIYKLLEVFRM